MARSHPGQLSLFDDYVPPPAPVLAARLESIETLGPEPDRLVFALLLGSKFAGDVASASGGAAAASTHLQLLDFGAAEMLEDAEIEELFAAGGVVEMRRFDLAFRQFGQAREGAALFPEDGNDGLDTVTDSLRALIRERGVLTGDAAERPHVPLCGQTVIPGPLARPVRSTARDLALLQVSAEGDVEILRKWALAA